jgi:AcrR family transcriptional regulator
MALPAEEPTAAQRVPLTRERVLRAAIRLADEKGLEALTMRKLGQALGVEAMTLYYHVGNKDSLLNAIVDLVEREIELPAGGTEWKAAVRKTAMSYHDVLQRHPWAAGLALRSTGSRPARWRYMNAVLGALREAGFPADLTDHAYHALDSHIAGFTLWVSQLDIDTEQLPDLATSFLEEIGDEHPYLVEHVHQHLKPRAPTPDAEPEDEFAFGLDLILDGLERLRDSA